MNTQIFGLAERVKPIELDLAELYMPKANKLTTDA